MYTYKYQRAALTVDALVFAKAGNKIFILLIERGIEPFLGMWALPGGFVDIGETLEDACIRELNEETGMEVDEMKQFYTFDAINRDPRHRTISVVYYAILNELREVKGADDANKAQWLLLDDLPTLAFDHAEIIELFTTKIGFS